MSFTIGVCGFSGTGSSAVVDLLKEYEINQVIDKCEFILPYEPDGIVDLDFHLNKGTCKYSSSNTAIFRFLKAIRGGQFRYIRELSSGKLVKYGEDYINNLVQCDWVGSDPANACNSPLRDLARRAVGKFHFGKPYYYLEKMFGRNLNLFPMGQMRFSSYPDGFYQHTREFLLNVIDSLEPINPAKNLVLDQPFPGNNPELCFPYFFNPKAIVVDRDPRDIYLLTKEFWFKSQAWRPLPTDTVEHFVSYYRGLRLSDSLTKKNENVLKIQFEDLVYRYDETRIKIEKFLDLPSNMNQMTHFNPALSINNTQVFNYYSGYKSEIQQIERALPEYLFPFEKYGEVRFDRESMFE